MSTESLRKDHDLIEKVLKAMALTVNLLEDGKQIPEPILEQVIDFTHNFTDVCHHTKEEKTLFPALESVGMPTRMGPIAVMLMEHKQSRKIADVIKAEIKKYLDTGNRTGLIESMKAYIQHLTEHIWKENNRLFVMAEMRLGRISPKVAADLEKTEREQMKEIEHDPKYYIKLASNLDTMLKEI